jgi:phosphatidylserine/phosphatidylglycerophosphate/cardiolipin synthase-like enzyme
MPAPDWFLSATERGNPATVLDSRHANGLAWTTGNLVRPLIHGAHYFAELKERVDALQAGDLLMFVDWRGDPDEHLTDDPQSEVSAVFCQATARGVDVRGLVWRSHLDQLQFSASENRHLGEEITRAGGECLLDMRVRPGGSHHQKFAVLRHAERPERDIAFLGGIDLCHSRRDDETHRGDPQPQPMAKVYGSRPPWHDVQLAITGPAVGDVETVFRERWDDPQPLSQSPIRRIADRIRSEDTRPSPLPPQRPDPDPTGPHAVQVLRTYPTRLDGYQFAPDGERSVARGYRKALGQARQLIYVEDQYLWSDDVADIFARALREHSALLMIAVLPHYPDQDGRMSMPPNLVGREHALHVLREAAAERFAVYGIESPQQVPTYVHAKVCVIDDLWASVGSANLNRRSWTHDSEVSAAVWDAGADQDELRDSYPRELRLRLAREHLERQPGDDRDLVDPASAFEAFGKSAAALQQWYDDGRSRPRPPGRLRALTEMPLSKATRRWATPLYHTIYDPDGRPRWMRRKHTF